MPVSGDPAALDPRRQHRGDPDHREAGGQEAGHQMRKTPATSPGSVIVEMTSWIAETLAATTSSTFTPNM
jgi:hypothetical protein